MENLTYGSRYRVTEKIGSGGMAEVFKAVDETLGRTVAIKVLHARYAAEEGFVARFRQEAQAAANLSHPNIVNIYDWGKEGETYYIIMEYVRGTDLKTLLQQKGRVDPMKAAEYASQVCAALAVAHGYDIIHRDIKPHNIVLTPDGIIKVMDFGIARAGNTTLTQTGSVLGTAHYLAPEQAQGRTLSPASDLYALGVVLYELTTGRLPFDADTPVAVALKQVNEQPVPPRELNPEIPAPLDAVILKAMRKDPSARYDSAEEMRADLKNVIEGRAVAAAAAAPADATSVMPAVPVTATATTRRAAPPRKSRAWVWALIVLLLAGSALAAWAILSNGPEMVAVPNVTGMQQADAEKRIEEAGLKVGEVTPQERGDVKPGVVLEQDPAPADQVEEGSAVNLVVAKEEAKVEVPYLLDQDKDEAIRAIEAAGLEQGEFKTRETEDTEPDRVLSQDPKAGSMVKKGTKVDIVYAVAPKTGTVPDVEGDPQGSAESAIENAGFSVRVREAFNDDVAEGRVISQDPDGGSERKLGTTVTIVVSKGVETVGVPDVTGDTEDQAIEELEGRGFEVLVNTTNSDPTRPGRVITQNPVGGSQAEKGSRVTIFVQEEAGP